MRSEGQFAESLHFSASSFHLQKGNEGNENEESSRVAAK